MSLEQEFVGWPEATRARRAAYNHWTRVFEKRSPGVTHLFSLGCRHQRMCGAIEWTKARHRFIGAAMARGDDQVIVVERARCRMHLARSGIDPLDSRLDEVDALRLERPFKFE